MPYRIHSVRNDVAALGNTSAITIPDCLSFSIQNNPDLASAVTAGETMATHAILRSQRVTCSFDTLAIARALDATGMTTQPIATSGSPAHTGLIFYLEALETTGEASAGSVHRSLLISSGAIIPRTISASHGGDARISYDVAVIKKTAANAIVIADNASLPTLASNATLYGGNTWTIGPITVGSVTLSNYRSVEIDFGNVVNTGGSESALFDTHIETVTHAPTITIRGIDPTWFKESSGIPIAGTFTYHGMGQVYLRKRTPGAPSYVADNTAEHIKFTSQGIVAMQTYAAGQGHQFAESAIVIKTFYDGANAPLIVDTTSQIT